MCRSTIQQAFRWSSQQPAALRLRTFNSSLVRGAIPPPIQAPTQSQKGRNPSKSGFRPFCCAALPEASIATRGNVGATLGASASFGDRDIPDALADVAPQGPIHRQKGRLAGFQVLPDLVTRSSSALGDAPAPLYGWRDLPCHPYALHRRWYSHEPAGQAARNRYPRSTRQDPQITSALSASSELRSHRCVKRRGFGA